MRRPDPHPSFRRQRSVVGRPRAARCAATVFALFVVASAPVNGGLVVPQGFAGLEDADGWSGTLSQSSGSIRLQEVYSGSQFPARPILITEMRWRRDASGSPTGGTPPMSGTLPNLEIRLSATSQAPDALSTVFAQNVGADEVVVFRGDWAFSSQSVGPPGGPNPFDLVVRFTQPFQYDPARGNLLVDIRAGTTLPGLHVEASNEFSDGSSRAFSWAVNDETTWATDTGADVLEFVYDSQLEIQPAGGWVQGTTTVTLVTTIAGGEIRHTLEGTEPGAESPLYTGPLTLTDSALVRARVFTNGVAASPEASALFLRASWNDGIAQAWRESSFGPRWWLDSQASALADPDGDGTSNYQEYLTGTDPRRADSVPQQAVRVSTYAGSTSGFADGPRLEAKFDGAIADMAFDKERRLWILETSATGYYEPGPSGHRIRRIDADGLLTTVAGGPAGNVDGAASLARFSIPNGLVVHGSDDVFVIDRGNHTLRRLDPAGLVSTFAGSTMGYQDGVGSAAQFGAPMGLAGDGEGNLYVADFWNLRIRKVAPDRTVTTYANLAGNRGGQDGDRAIASFDSPNDIFAAPDGSLIVSDWTNHRIRRISPDGQVTTPASGLPFWPERVSVDAGGRIYVSGSTSAGGTSQLSVYRSDGTLLWTLVPPAKAYVDGPVGQACFEGISRVIQLPSGDLLVGDWNRIRQIQVAMPPLLTLSPDAGTYGGSVEVEITSAAPAEIHYTTDGSDPGADSPSATGTARITLASSTTVKARLLVNGNPVSETVSASYTIEPLPPTIAVQPRDTTLYEGQSLRLSVGVTGTPPFQFQWYHGEALLAGATAPAYEVPAVTPADAGPYLVKVYSALGGVTSRVATVTVQPAPKPPLIIEHPRRQTVVIGGTATFSVVATGDEPLSYTWRRSGLLIAGATQPTLVLSNVQPTQMGSYSVRVSNAAGFVYSTPATLSIVSQPLPPSIVTQSSSPTVQAGTDVLLVTAVSGTEPLTFLWTRNGEALPESDGPSLGLKRVQPAQAGTYLLRVTNPVGSAVSQPFVVEVDPGLPGGTVVFSNQGGEHEAPVFDADGVTRLAGPAFLAQLHAGPTAETLAPVGGAVPFLRDAAAGYWHLATRTITAVPPGATAAVRVRVWESAFGSTFEQALANGGKTGQSDVVIVVTGGVGDPPSSPAFLVGLRSFSVHADQQPPVVALSAPTAGTTSDERFTLIGTATDNGRIASLTWELNGRIMGPVALDHHAFSVTGQRLERGENRIRVVALDGAGNMAETGVVITWTPVRTLTLNGTAEVTEGARVVLPLALVSPGDVGGLTFDLTYDREWLAEPEFAWDDAMASGTRQLNFDTAGRVRGTLALPGIGLPAGERTLGWLSLRARSVPAPQVVMPGVAVMDIADAAGSQLAYGTAATGTTVTIRTRTFTGDNNANQRLDVGDATIIQRLLAGPDERRAWDVAANDMNLSQALDSGDVIKVLRAVVGLDPQPAGAIVPTSARGSSRSGLQRHGPTSMTGSGRLLTQHNVSAVGEQLQVQVLLVDLGRPISGASFRLRYPASILRLTGPLGYRTGALVPMDAYAVWNVWPDYRQQAGQLSCAVISGQAWSASNGVVAELTFQVQPGVLTSLAPIRLETVEVTTGGGFETAWLPGGEVPLDTALPLTLEGFNAPALTPMGFQFTVAGPGGSQAAVDASTDLKTWEPLGTLDLRTGVAPFEDPLVTGRTMRFYRVRTP